MCATVVWHGKVYVTAMYQCYTHKTFILQCYFYVTLI